MDHDVKLPELGENIEAVEVSNVLVAVGDTVAVDQALVEVETDKATMEIPSPLAGRVTAVRVATGDSVAVGQVLLQLAAETETEAEPEAGGTESEPEARGTETEPEARGTETEPEARGTETEEGAASEVADGPRQAEESAAGAGPPAPVDDGAEGPREAAAAPADEDRASEPPLADPVPAAPSVRRLARELGLDPRDVPGSGPAGRISAADVMADARRRIADAGSGAGRPEPGGGPALPDPAEFGPVERQPMPKIRRVTAENMARSWSLIPHVTQHDRADLTELEAFRQRYGARVAAAGGKLTLTAVLLKLTAAALRAHRTLNAALDLQTGEIVYRRYVHIGVAVDTDRGLLVPVVRDADRKSIAALAVELADLAARARSKQLLPDEMRGAGFTVSNLGGLGTTDFSPIVTWPQAAVLGIGRAATEAVWREGAFVPRSILPLSLSYDHRLVDGAEAARFLRWLAEAVEQPLLLFLEDEA